jgi:ABC-type sugar transport system ATPase subunit
VGLAGLVGSGRTEFGEALFGLRPRTGTLHLAGHPIKLGIQAALNAGIGLIPEDRKRHGLFLDQTLRENVVLTVLDRLAKSTWRSCQRENSLASQSIKNLQIRPPDPKKQARTFSGGNQQKIVLAKWLARKSKVLIVDEPTRGVDVGAKMEIHRLLQEFVLTGGSILLISSELPELLALSHRILILREGRWMGEVPAANANEHILMQRMAGTTA